MTAQSLPPAQSTQDILNHPASESGQLEPGTVPAPTADAYALPLKILSNRLPFQLGLTVGGYYDDNIYLRPPGASKIADFIWSLAPYLAWNSAAETGAKNSVQLSYAPTLIFYQDETTNDTVDQAVNASYGFEGDRLKIVATQAYARFQEDNADVLNLVTETSSVTTLHANYRMTEKTDLSFTARQTYTSDDPGFRSAEWTAAGYADYNVTAKTSAGLGGLLGAVDLEGPNQTYEQLNGHLSYDPDPRLSFTATGGAEWRETQHHDGTQLSPDFALDVAYMPFDGTNLGLTAYRRFDYSNRIFGDDYIATGVSASITQRFLHRFYFSVAGVFEDANYQDNFSVTSAPENYNYFSIRPGLEFTPFSGSDLKIFYQFRTSSEQGGTTAFNDSEVGFSAQFTY